MPTWESTMRLRFVVQCIARPSARHPDERKISTCVLCPHRYFTSRTQKCNAHDQKITQWCGDVHVYAMLFIACIFYCLLTCCRFGFSPPREKCHKEPSKKIDFSPCRGGALRLVPIVTSLKIFLCQRHSFVLHIARHCTCRLCYTPHDPSDNTIRLLTSNASCFNLSPRTSLGPMASTSIT